MSWLSMSANNTRFVLVDALNAEWDALNGDGCMAARSRTLLSHWADNFRVLSGCKCPAEVLERIRYRPDEVLAVLIELYQYRRNGTNASAQRRQLRPEHAGAGELAGRIIVQTMLGKLVSMARRDRRYGIEEYTAALWARLGSYSLERRPVRIAANLALDTLKEVTRSRARVQLVPLGCDLDPVPTIEGAADEIPLSAHRVLRDACELGLIDDRTRQLLSAVYAEGMSGQEVAAALGLAPTTVRYRCSRAVRKLAQHAQVLAAA